MREGDPLGPEDDERHMGHFPHPLRPLESCWGPGLVLCLWAPPLLHWSCWGEEEERWTGMDLQDWRIRGGVEDVSLTHSVPRKPAGPPFLVLWPLGTPPTAWVLGAWEGGREEGGRWTVVG